ncbi:MarR family transcriptional regulator [Desulfosporosinus sp. PR]|uniref:MarR family winged helix-turn-helix transcriptional regulator n=1 Tax=Candidatus Desulfosporosinus nitrosoreducens TaxID=3401928 RepID=UPI0027EA8638|nr:MarR family transcriptional regulator [Desulfosporosinus sp. PR]MDQ7092319.1 MarR family transcriptional regulator [Desulfosporosinus sp. PR]
MEIDKNVWVPYTHDMMNEDEFKKIKIAYSLFEIIYEFLDIDKKPRYYGTDVPIFHAEIHMLKAIKENEGIHVAGLANYLRITKGSISEMTMKLEKKGLIKKERDTQNQLKIVLKLTPKGELAHKNHLKAHEEYNQMILEILKDEHEEKISFLNNFLLTLKDKLSDFGEKV